jgi:hypothetical protein
MLTEDPEDAPLNLANATTSDLRHPDIISRWRAQPSANTPESVISPTSPGVQLTNLLAGRSFRE